MELLDEELVHILSCASGFSPQFCALLYPGTGETPLLRSCRPLESDAGRANALRGSRFTLRQHGTPNAHPANLSPGEIPSG